MTDFRERFAELLEKNEGCDSDFANALGVSKQTVSAWKLGTRSPKKPTIKSIAAYFKVSVAWLMGLDEVPEEPAPPAPSISPSESHLLSLYRSLNAPGQEKLVDYADDLVSSGKYSKDTASSTA